MDADAGQILVVDDSRLIARAVAGELAAAGYRVETCHSGEDAVASLRSGTPVDLVLMDIHLGPGIDGFAAAEQIRASRDVPLIFFTSDLDEESVARGRHISHYGYLAKDSGPRALTEAVALALRLDAAQCRLQAAERHSRDTFFHAPAALMLVDPRSSEIRDANAAAAGLLGMPPGQLEGSRLSEHISARDREQLLEDLNRPGQHECTLRLRGEGDAGKRFCRIAMTPVQIDGAAWSYLSLTDISESEQARAELERSQGRHAELVRNAPIGIFRIYSDGETIEVNHALARILGCRDAEEVRTRYPRLTRSIVEDGDALDALALRLREDGGVSGEALWITRGDGARLCLRADARIAAEHPDGRTEIEGFAIDITSQRRAEDFARLLAEEVPAMVWAYDVEAQRNVWVNRQLQSFLQEYVDGVPGSALGDQILRVIHPDDHEQLLAATAAVMSTQTKVPVEFRLPATAPGSWDWYRGTVVAFEASAVGTKRLLMGIASRVQDLKQELEQRELALSETNHRVKNNLMLVSTLLSLHESTMEIDLGSIRGQIDAIAQVHDHLSHADGSTSVQLDRQVAALVSVATVTDPRLRIRQEVEPLELSSRNAVTVGLLINELVTNAIKHGLPGTAEPYLEVSCRRLDDQQIELSVANNGAPLPADFDRDDGGTMGRTVISSLVDQLKGELLIEREPLTRMTCRLRVPLI